MLSLVLICELFLCLINTCGAVCGRRCKGPGGRDLEEHEMVFKLFYAVLWSTLFLTITLYLTISIQIFSLDVDGLTDLTAIGLVAFYYMPTIF